MIYNNIKHLLKRIWWKIEKPNEVEYDNYIKNTGIKLYPKVKSIDNTIEEIVKNKKSIARYGDGEFMLCFYRSIGFQKRDKNLRKRLIEILRNENPNCLIAIPEYRDHHLTLFWKQFWYENTQDILRLLNFKTTYYNPSITREIDLNQLDYLKKSWTNREVVFVTGKGSRFDDHHELFDNIKSSYTICGLATNAWSEYPSLFQQTIECTKKFDNPLVICSLGPTATVLAYDLSLNNIQAIDIGHITNTFDQKKYNKNLPENLSAV